MFRNVRRTCWNKYVNELEQKLNERILRPVPVPSSKENIDVLANKVHSVITNSYEAACPMRKSLRTRGGVKDTRLEAKAKDTKKSEAKDNLSEDRHSRGQGQECSRPGTKVTSASALQKKRSSQKFFRRSSHKKTFSKQFFKRSTKF